MDEELQNLRNFAESAGNTGGIERNSLGVLENGLGVLKNSADIDKIEEELSEIKESLANQGFSNSITLHVDLMRRYRVRI